MKSIPAGPRIYGSLAGGYSRIPGYLIVRLALDVSFHGHGYGAHLLLDALDKVVRAAEIGGGRLIVVDAIDDEAYEFPEHFDFIPVKNRRGRLVMKMSTAASALRAAQDQPRLPSSLKSPHKSEVCLT